MKATALELACADLLAGERAGRSDVGRRRELLELLDKLRRRDRTGCAGLLFFELEELPAEPDPKRRLVPVDNTNFSW